MATKKSNKFIYFALAIIVLFCTFILHIFIVKQSHAIAQVEYNTINNQIIPLNIGKNDPAIDMSDANTQDLTHIKYIQNSGYFLANPQHAPQNPSYNVAGTCTTVAMQLLLGYHNYNTDRRLIPEFGKNGRRFLSNDFGDLLQSPIVHPNNAVGQGRSSIGTEKGVYDEIYDLTVLGSFPGLGQAVGPVANAATDFINEYSIIKDNVTIKSSSFSLNQVYDEINADRPVIVGMSIILNGADSYHVVVAYGYATLKGIPGLIVHYGWGDKNFHAWVPCEYFGYQIKMQVRHTHNLIDTEINLINTYRELKCSECGYSTVDNLYNLDETCHKIISINYIIKGKIIIPNTINNISIKEIGNNVFANTYIHEIELGYNITNIGNSAFKNCEQLSSINITSGIQQIGFEAFSGCNNLNFIVNEYSQYFSVIDNMLCNKQQTSILHTGNISTKIVIPESITQIAPYAFAGNGNLQILKFNNPITTISEYAFSDCNNLSEVVFNSEVTKIDDRAFADCANLGVVMFKSNNAPAVGSDVLLNDDITIYVPYNAQSTYKAAFSQYASRIDSVRFPVYFMDGEHVIETRDVYYGSTISLPDYSPVGYDLIGWYDNLEFTGEPYVNGGLWNSEGTVMLYAKTEPQDCTVVFDADGGVLSGGNILTVKYGQAFTTDVTATKTGNVLDGWYLGDVKYVTEDGRSMRTWDRTEITTLTAKWSLKEYEIQINDKGNITWLSNAGLSDEPCYIQYGTVLNAINLIAIFKQSAQGYKEGRIFDHFNYGDATLDWTSIPDLGADKSVITIVPVWKKEKHTIYFNTLCNVTVNEITACYENSITLPTPYRKGYTFGGWYDEEIGGTKIEWVLMPDLTENEQSNGSTQLFAKWTNNTYKVYYKANGGRGTMTLTNHTYDYASNLRLNSFTRTGHDFIGWATSETGTAEYADGASVMNLASGQGASVNLYAVWQAKKYKITYKNLTEGMIVNPDQYTFGIGIYPMPVIKIKDPNGRYQNLDKFYGWYTSTDFNTQVTTISTEMTGEITLYAKYDYFVMAIHDTGKTYTVTDAGVNKNPNFDLDIYLKSVYYDKIKDTTLKKVRIEFSFDLWEVDDGYQHIYIRIKDLPLVSIWSKKIDHSGGKKPYTYTAEFDIEDLKTYDNLVMYFDASGAFSDTWKFNNFNLSVYLVN